MMSQEEYARLLALYRQLCNKPRPKIPWEDIVPRTKKYLKWLEEKKKEEQPSNERE